MPSTSPTLTAGLGMKDRQGISPGRKIRHFFDAEPISIERGVACSCFGSLSSCFLCGALAKSHYLPCGQHCSGVTGLQEGAVTEACGNMEVSLSSLELRYPLRYNLHSSQTELRILPQIITFLGFASSVPLPCSPFLDSPRKTVLVNHLPTNP